MNLLPEHITAIDTLIEKRKGEFLVKTHETIDTTVDAINNVMQLKNDLENGERVPQEQIIPLDILALRMPEIFNLMNETQGNPSASEISDFLESLPEQQKKFEYSRLLLIYIFEKFFKIANPGIQRTGGVILSNKTMIDLLLLNTNPNIHPNIEKLVNMGEKIALDTFHMLLTAKPLGRLGDSNIKHL